MWRGRQEHPKPPQAEVREAAPWVGAWAGSGNPARLPVACPHPPSRELGQTMPMGAAGEAPCVCTGHPGMWRDRPWGPLSQDLQALGQEGEGPLSAGGPGPVGRWAQGKWGPRWKEAPCGWVWSTAGGSARVLGFSPGSRFGPGQGFFTHPLAHLLPPGVQPSGQALAPTCPGLGMGGK